MPNIRRAGAALAFLTISCGKARPGELDRRPHPMSNDCNRPAINNSSLLRSISQALTEHSKDTVGIRISITPAGEWYKPKGEDSRYWVKRLCWSLVSESGRPHQAFARSCAW